MTRKEYKMTTIDLLPTQYKALKVMAAETGTSMAEIMRYAADDFLSKHKKGYVKTQDSMRVFKQNNKDTIKYLGEE